MSLCMCDNMSLCKCDNMSLRKCDLFGADMSLRVLHAHAMAVASAAVHSPGPPQKIPQAPPGTTADATAIFPTFERCVFLPNMHVLRAHGVPHLFASVTTGLFASVTTCLFASVPCKTMQNHASATEDVAKVYRLLTREETPLISANAPVLGQMAASDAAVSKAKCAVETAGVKNPSHQATVFCRPVGANGNLLQSPDLHSRTEGLCSMNPKTSSTASTATCCLLQTHQATRGPCKMHLHQRSLTQRQFVKTNRPSLGCVAPGSKFAFATVIFGNDARFSLEGVLMGASIKDELRWTYCVCTPARSQKHGAKVWLLSARGFRK